MSVQRQRLRNPDNILTSLKKVLYISYDGMTDQLGQSQVIPYLRGLTAKGYSFTLLSVEKTQKLKKTGGAVRKMMEQYGIEWRTIPFSTRPPLLSKWYDQRKLNSMAEKLYKEKTFDLVHCRSYVAAEAGMRLSTKHNIPFLFDMRGFWVDERVDSGLWKLNNPFFNFLYKHFKKKEKQYFSRSRHVISLTHKGKEELVKNYGLSNSKVTVIPCCVDLEHFDYHTHNAKEKNDLKEALGISQEAPVISYLGSLGGWYLTDEMIRFFTVMKKRFAEAIFLLITNDNAVSIKNKMDEFGLTDKDYRVRAASRSEVPAYLSISDWNIFFIKDAYSKKASSPTKQGEVMAMGIPIICNDIGDTGQIVRESAAGIVINQFDMKEYEKAVEQLDRLRSTDRSAIRTSASQYYDLQNGVSRYEEVYNQLLATTTH